MSSDESIQKTQVEQTHIEVFETSIQQLNAPLANYLGDIGLPTDGVLMPLDERAVVIRALESAISVLPIPDRAKAHYISKFAVAASIGLFDAALNYLWNETVSALRGLATTIDLSYFFDVAEKREKYRSKLESAEDLDQLDDHTLVATCARVGLINEVNRERLHHINYMRNHASAAHPNQNDLNGAEMVAWLTNCLRYAIRAEPDASALEVKRLLYNIRESEIPESDFAVIGEEVSKLPQDRADDFLWTIFGQYTDPSSAAETKQNIRGVATHVWKVVTEDRRYAVGARYAYFVKHGDQDRKTAANDFLQAVDGQRYKSEEILVAEILERLQSLRKAHFGHNNFYNEWPHASALKKSLPQSGKVPRPVRREWVKVISQCWVGNGKGYKEGVDQSAARHYQEHIKNFGDPEIAEFIDLFADPDFTVDFGYTKAEERVRELADQLKTQTKNLFLKQALDTILAAPKGTLRRLAGTVDYRSRKANIPNFEGS